MLYLITGHLPVRKTSYPHDKEFHLTSEDLRPHALGGNYYRHIWALQPQSHMSINQGLINP